MRATFARRTTAATATAMAALLIAACGGTGEEAVRRDLARTERRLHARASTGRSAATGAAVDGTLESYVAIAMRNAPSLEASFDRWRAAVNRISRSRRLPEPTITYGFFLSSVETRVGPQRQRLGLQQMFPWPSKLSAGADMTSAQARALERRFDAEALALRQRVADAYWRLWLIRETRGIQREQLEIVRGLSESARARIATGGTTLADQQQIDLSAARLEDMLAGLDEMETMATAMLQAVLGGPEGTTPRSPRGGTTLPTTSAPPALALPAEPESALLRAVLEHPAVTAFELVAEANEADARSQGADRYPTFMLGVDWIETGPARMAGQADSGKDAVMVGVGLRLPLWQGSYGDSVEAARAEAEAARADGRAAADRATAELDSALATLRDAVRRVRLHRDTLIPQAEAAYESVLGAYATSRSTVSAALLAQRDLLELRLGLERANADQATAWSRLEQVVGRTVRRRAVEQGANR